MRADLQAVSLPTAASKAIPKGAHGRTTFPRVASPTWTIRRNQFQDQFRDEVVIRLQQLNTGQLRVVLDWNPEGPHVSYIYNVHIIDLVINNILINHCGKSQWTVNGTTIVTYTVNTSNIDLYAVSFVHSVAS